MSQTKRDSERRVFAALSYIVPLVGGIIAIALDGRNPLTRVHAQQSIAAVLTLIVSFFLWGVIGYALALIPIFGPIVAISLFSLVIATAIFLAVNWLFSFIQALRGETRTIPLANRIAIRVFGETNAQKQSA